MREVTCEVYLSTLLKLHSARCCEHPVKQHFACCCEHNRTATVPLRCLLCQWQEKLAVAANDQNRVVSTGLKICPISGCSFMPNFPNFLFSTMSSVLSRTSSLFSLDMGLFKDVKLDATVSRMITSACFRSS